MGQDLKLAVDGAQMPAYLALPAGAPRGGVVVLQEIYGITRGMKYAADLLASEGYAAVVPELFHRTERDWVGAPGGEDANRGIAAARQMTLDAFEHDLNASVAALRERIPASGKIAVWGFCLGGSLAFYSATLPYVDAAISFYGGQIAKANVLDAPPMLERFAAAVHAPLLFAFGEEDHGIPLEDREKIRTTLTAAGKPFAMNAYPGVGHAFFRDGLESSQAARDAWQAVREFLGANAG